jgi:hypothetical protein
MAGDRYDQEVERLAALGDRAVREAWVYGNEHSPLFDGLDMTREGSCLTIVADIARLGRYPTWLPRDLCLALAADLRVPSDRMDLTVESLPACREWQRRFDEALGRQPPPLLPEPGEVAP